MIERVWSKVYYFIPPILYTIFFGFLILDGNDFSEVIATIRGADPLVFVYAAMSALASLLLMCGQFWGAAFGLLCGAGFIWEGFGDPLAAQIWFYFAAFWIVFYLVFGIKVYRRRRA